MIGFFDSGIGGVTVLREVIKILPNYHYIYYSDSINNPYGDKDKEQLLVITKKIVQELIDRGCEVIVIACNTAGAICKDYLRNTFNIPIIVIEPALKLALDSNPQGKTLVMATQGTVESENFHKLCEQFDNFNFIIKSFPGLADLIERGEMEKVKYYLKDNLSLEKVDNVVLGCTHYPLIKKEIIAVLGDVNFFDGSLGVAKRLLQVVHDINLKESNFEVKFIDTANDGEKEKRFYQLLNL